VTLSGKIVSRYKAVPSGCGLLVADMIASRLPWSPAKGSHAAWLQTLNWLFLSGNPTNRTLDQGGAQPDTQVGRKHLTRHSSPDPVHQSNRP
jgi:asparagine N-glycosylation enzyme membrane subunit Stt3